MEDAARCAARTGVNVPDDPTPTPPWLSRTSIRGLYLLNRVPKALLLLTIAGLLLLALFVEGIIGGICLLLLGAFFGWLLLISWPVLSPIGRLLRLLVVGVIVAFAVQMILA
jgi:hypothetical protein